MPERAVVPERALVAGAYAWRLPEGWHVVRFDLSYNRYHGFLAHDQLEASVTLGHYGGAECEVVVSEDTPPVDAWLVPLLLALETVPPANRERHGVTARIDARTWGW